MQLFAIVTFTRSSPSSVNDADALDPRTTIEPDTRAPPAPTSSTPEPLIEQMPDREHEM